MTAFEANFDGLIGPTHNYGGLSDGNLASAANSGLVARPRQAALQGLEKMKTMYDAGLKQGILPPHQRPYLPLLRDSGFAGTDHEIFVEGWKDAPRLMKNVMSASSMWAANAATVSPSADTSDGRLHLTPANLSTMLHRSIEHDQTGRALRRAFPFAAVHPALPQQAYYSDEGAANHVRLCQSRGETGVELFVYGRDGLAPAKPGYPARQTLQASKAIVRRHRLNPKHVVFAKQSEQAINAGAFHNDVVCVGAMQTLFFHELAFENLEVLKSDIIRASDGLFDPIMVEVKDADVPIKDAIKAYLFNSMLVKFPQDTRLTLIAPLETEENENTRTYCEKLVRSNGPIGFVKYVDVRQSMRNGGGPACLRLRVTLTESEWERCHIGNKFSPELYVKLREWVTQYYRETLAPEDIRSPEIMEESFQALSALTEIMDLGSDFYAFQR